MDNTMKLLNGEDTLFDTPEFEAAASLALKAFKKQYPSTTSADWQTFVLGLRVGYGYGHLQGEIEQYRIDHPEPLSLDDLNEEWVDSFY